MTTAAATIVDDELILNPLLDPCMAELAHAMDYHDTVESDEQQIREATLRITRLKHALWRRGVRDDVINRILDGETL